MEKEKKPAVDKHIFEVEKRKLNKKEPKPLLKEVGSSFEAAQMTLKYFYIPFFLFGIILGPTLLGAICSFLFVSCFYTSEIIGEAIKDEFKDTSDKIQKGDAKASFDGYSKVLEKNKELEIKIQQKKEAIAKKEAALSEAASLTPQAEKSEKKLFKWRNKKTSEQEQSL